jgi:hypothetical protein
MRSDQSPGDAIAENVIATACAPEKSLRNFGAIVDLDQSRPIHLGKKIFFIRKDMPMISLEDCIGMCGLDPDEVAAIGEHEHIPDIAAAALADYLLKQAGGPERIRAMIVDDIHKALDAGHIRHGAELFMALRHFLEQHPEANPEPGN